MTDARAHDPPSDLVARWASLLAPRWTPGRRALDIASGRGRNAVALAQAGYRVTAIDRRLDALAEAVSRARPGKDAVAGGSVQAICADLRAWPLLDAGFELIVVTRYLERDLFPRVQSALVPGGVLIYETFTELQLLHRRGPQSASHLLKPGELRVRLRNLEILFDEEVTAPDALARIVARRPA
ncbi:MAG: class I SAM-dependent methyltransferase [Vicinamibacterales bacterium]